MTNQVLVAFDESPQAYAALKHALLHFDAAEITVLHAQDPSEWVYGDAMSGGYYSEEAFEETEKRTKELLEEASSIAQENNREITTVSETGSPTHVIVDYADEHDIDHIVLGSHGRRGLSRFLLGSVAETVVKRSPVSVTIIREEDA